MEYAIGFYNIIMITIFSSIILSKNLNSAYFWKKKNTWRMIS